MLHGIAESQELAGGGLAASLFMAFNAKACEVHQLPQPNFLPFSQHLSPRSVFFFCFFPATHCFLSPTPHPSPPITHGS